MLPFRNEIQKSLKTIRMLLEICASTIQSAVNAQTAGAHRVELCRELAVGGITPSFGMVQEVLSRLTIPVFVLIRPRSGHFVYTDAEFEIMKADILQYKKMGCSGIVSGVLNAEGTIDVDRTQKLVELSKPLPFTFHRAFDVTTNPSQALETLIEMGVSRVLTSGQAMSAIEGIELLKHLQKQASGRIQLLPGGGINQNNVHIFKDAGFTEIHASASTLVQEYKPPKVAMNSPKFFNEHQLYESSVEDIRNILIQCNDI